MPYLCFECPNCHNTIDELQKLADPAPFCGPCSVVMQRVIPSATSFRLMGGGWAAAGYTKYRQNTKVHKE